MEADMILVLLFTAIFVGFVVFIEIHTRREQSVSQKKEPLAGSPGEAPKTEAGLTKIGVKPKNQDK